MKSSKTMVAALLAGRLAIASTAHAQVSYKDMADALHAVMESDRTVYTRMVVNRLANEVLEVEEPVTHPRSQILIPLFTETDSKFHQLPGPELCG